LKESAITVGAVDLYDMELLHQRAAVGILIDQPFQRKGLASQTLFLLVQYAFHFLHLHQLYAYIPVANLPSRQLFMKCGFQSMGVLKDWISTAYGYADVEVVARVYDGKSETPG
jgi:diamine N-acetyltransferase